MKLRLLILLGFGIAGLSTTMLNASNYTSLVSKIELRDINLQEIETLENSISQLSSEYFNNIDTDIACTLEEVIMYLSEYDEFEIARIQSFSIDGNSIIILDDITSLKDTSICDGYEITINTTSPLDMVSFLEDSPILYHSVDIMLASQSIVVRVRIGGEPYA